MSRQETRSISNFLQIVVLYNVIFFLLFVTYINFIVPIFGTEWLYVLYDTRKIIIGAVLVLFLSLLLGLKTTSAKSLFLHILFSFPILPMIVIYAVGGGAQSYLFLAVACYLLVYLIVSVPPYNFDQDRRILDFLEVLSVSGVLKLCLAVSIFVILVLFIQGDMALINFNPDKVYDFRRQAAASSSVFMGYMITNVIDGILPMGVAAALYCRKWFSVFLFLVIGFLIFGLTSLKTPLFIAPTVMVIYWALRQKFPIRFILIGQIAALILGLYSPLLGDAESRFGTYAVRRTYFVPAHVNYLHYDFFSKNEKSKWSHSKITLGLVPKAYKYPTARIIGEEYTNVDFSKRRDKYNNANTGWLGVGYAQFGVWGMGLYAMIIGLLIRFTQSLHRKTDLAFTGAALFVPYNTLFSSTDVPVAFLSHGIILLILLTALIRSSSGTR